MSWSFGIWSKWQKYSSNVRNTIYGNVLTQIGLGIFMVIYNFYIRELGYPDQLNGKVVSMTALATALILIPAGVFSDKFGRKKLILFGIILTGCSLITRSLIEPALFLVGAAFVTGLTQALIQVSMIPILAENSLPKQRIQLFALHSGLMTAANVIGNLSGGVMTDMFGTVFTPIFSIRLTLIVGAVIFLLGILPIVRIDEKINRNQTVKKELQVNILQNLKNQKASVKIIILFAIAQLVIGLGSGLVIPYLNLYFADRFQASNSSIGLIIALGQTATAIAMFIGPAVVRKIGEVKAVVFLQMASLPFLLLTAFTNNLILATIGFLFRQALMNAGNPIQMSLMMGKVDNSVKGFANSVNQMVFQLGWAFMGPISMGLVATYGAYHGYAFVFSITCILYFIASTYFYFVFKSINNDHTVLVEKGEDTKVS
ncbi:MAG TPA: MFS transporter [Bacillaceae bacterium]|nr:MFS transporter [Paenibacillus bovis]HLU21351.1 MFS transporter [Bacillaceae bacterium]